MNEAVRGTGAPDMPEPTPCATEDTGEGRTASPLESSIRAEDLRVLASGIVRYARWGHERARAWEDEITAHIAVANYHRTVRLAEEHRRGPVSKEDLEAAWDDAETAMETDRGRRKVLMRDYVSLKRTRIGTKDGRTQPVYAAVAGRYWLGERGASEMLAGSGFLYQPVLKDDREDVLQDVQRRFRQNVAEQIAQRWGLEVLPASENLDRIEWLVIWECDEDTVDRVRSFEQGWGVRPKDLEGKSASDLTGRDIARLMAMRGQKVAPHRGTPIQEPEAPLVEQREWGSGIRERVTEDDDAAG